MNEGPVNFKPSDVDLRSSYPPLVGSMGSTEAEIAAAMIVRTCQVNGDAWQDVPAPMIGKVIKNDIAAMIEPFHSLNGNPFCRPSIQRLVDSGCAEWVGEPGRVIRFTRKGLEGLEKHVVGVATSGSGR